MSPSPVRPPAPVTPDGRPLRVLIVDDEPGLTEALVAAFRFRGWTATGVGTATEALEHARLDTPDLVVLDVMLPDGNGFEVLQDLRAREPALAVLFLSARDDPADRIRGIEIGGDDYLTKPFDLTEVLTRAQGLMRRAGLMRAQLANVIMVADLVLDVDAHEVRRGGELIHLTATEFAVLKYLAQRQRRVVSKEELLRKVWDQPAGTNTHVAELYVSYLRKKLDAGREPLIHTVRGTGYILRPPVS